MLKLTPQVVHEILAHAREHAPIEACGYLAEKEGVVSRVIRLTNADASPEHYSLVPAEQFAAVRELRKEGYRLRAVYHSHPASPARMSQEDIRLAADPGISYVIASLAGSIPDLKAFTVRDGVVASEEITIAGGSYYDLPATLPLELDEFDQLIKAHLRGALDAAALKPRRVPFGCYEQRKAGTYMLRVRTSGGAITPRQLRALGEISARYGADFVHITTRQEFQIHDVALENNVSALRELLNAGLATRGGGGNTVRNILLSPDAGVAPDEVFDPSPYAFALTSRLLAEPDSWVLPRKFKIAFSNSAADTAFAQFNDLGFIATVRNGVHGFKVYVAGGMGSKPEVGRLLHQFVPAEDIYFVVAAVKRVFDQHGNRKNKNAARLRFLWKSLGEARFRELYERELAQVRNTTQPLVTQAWPNCAAENISVLPIHDDSPGFARWKSRYVTAQRQSGLYSILVPAFLGNVKNTDVILLADFLAALGKDVVRATFGQNLRLRNIPEAYLGNVYAVAKNVSELTGAPRFLANSIACTGADTCQLGICLPKGALAAIMRRLERANIDLDALGDFQLNLSGCPNTCGQHSIADLGFYGKVGRTGQQMFPAYGVVAGAVLRDGEARLARNLDRVSARDLPEFVVDVLKTWLEKKPLYSSFAQYINTEGTADIRAIAERYRSVPEFEDDKNYYFDWGAKEVFSLVGKGMGECSAGLFDLIEVDLNTAKRLVCSVRASSADLYQVALCAARALLITRGIEASSDTAVFDNFTKHFIDAGLVNASFQDVIAAAQTRDTAQLEKRRAEVSALVEAVDQLYQSMDNSLRFPAESKPTAPAAEPAPSAAQVERDYRKVACPMNFVKVKLDLARMRNGELLRVLLGDGSPIQNVPRSVVQEGHKVLEQVRVGDYWSVVIEKQAGVGA